MDCFKAGHAAEAERRFRLALRLEPRHPDALNLLGMTLVREERAAEAVELFQLAVEIAPTAAHHLNLGFALMRADRPSDAIPCFERCLALSPALTEAYLYLGGCFRTLGKQSEAERALRAALAHDPKYDPARTELSKLLYDAGDVDEAHAVLRQSPPPLSYGRRLRLALTSITPIPRSSSEIHAQRAEFEAQLDALIAEGGTIDDPRKEVDVTAFYLSYHGLPNRALHEKVARLNLAAQPGLDWTAPHCAARRKAGRLRIGVISRFLHEHSIGRTTRGLVAKLNRKKFELTAIFIPPLIRDSYSRAIAADAERSIVLPYRLDAARGAIANLELDVLFYQDVGMDVFTYYLALARLARVQCVSFGHPDTTGIPNMDWWISSERFEPAGAEAHYSERLWKIPEVATLAYYYHPARGVSLPSREDLGLPSDTRLYACPQMLFKLHPEFDALVAGILRSDPAGRVVLIEPPKDPFGDALLQPLLRRMGETMPDVANRVLVLPRMSQVSFLGLLAASDVVLDTPHFNGMNSSLDSFSVGAPVITRPGPLQRMRHTAAMYDAMGFGELCAASDAEYVQLAVDIARNADRRRAYSRAIIERESILYEDLRVVRGFEAFFEHVAKDSPLYRSPALSAPR